MVDLDRMLFDSRKMGVFHFDMETCEMSHVKDLSLIPPPPPSPAHRMNLDYGDTHALEHIMAVMGMDRCISALGSGNDDTIFALVEYCICVSDIGRCEAATWYEGNQVRLSHPKANLVSQRISDAIEVIGDQDSHRSFFMEYLPLVTGDKRIMAAIDSKGVINAIDSEMTQVSNHNGDVSVEVRMITVVQIGTGMPVYFRTVPGNVLDAVTLTQTLDRLKSLGVDVAFTVVDAGYCTISNMKELSRRRVNFVTRLKPNLCLFKSLFEDHGDSLESEDNMVPYNGRIAYVKRVQCLIGDGVTGYGYLVLDTKKRHTEMTKAAERYERGEIAVSELQDVVRSAGRFALVSSFMIPEDTVLANYYLRQAAEQYFDLVNGYASLSPIRSHDAVKMNGAFMLSFIASAVLRRMQILLEGTGIPVRNALLALRNQKCLVYEGHIHIDEVCGKPAKAYKALGMEQESYRYLDGDAYREV